MSEAWRLLGEPRFGGILVVSDHASNHVPDEIALGIAPELLDLHIAIDIGVREVGALMAARAGIAAFQCGVSRLVCDVNRDPHAPGVIPIASDGHAVPGNAIDHEAHLARLARFHEPYHAALHAVLDDRPPALIVSLHSFTPCLATHPGEARPWQVGVLYNTDDRAARLAIPLLEAEGLVVGDQQPYSGHLLNYTMDRHAEAEGRPYLGIEIRQDEIGDAAGQAVWAERLARIANAVALGLG
ncbi:MAG: N-formylglutamate amidohydrolase [Sphingomonadales bacterium]|nr:N-formylglutamate amidohydrolase [Sphingomonadales bacterium]